MIDEKFSFTNFKIHTQYSICEGAIKIEDLAQYCKENKIPAIGLSDSANLCGALEFSESISKVWTQPIIGTQINFKYSDTIGKLPIFAKTIDGYKNLTKLSSSSYLESEVTSEPYCDLENLYNNSKNEDFSEICITSHASIVKDDNIENDIEIVTEKAEGNKCPVCWKISKSACARHGHLKL